MKAVVTGAGGFAGRHLCAHLTAEGDDVIGLDRHGANAVDVTDRDALHRHLAEAAPEVVYHLAAITHVGESWANASQVLRVNVEGTGNVLDAAWAAGVRRVLVVGSAEEYGRVDAGSDRLTEAAPLRPLTPYGSSKVAASFLALQAYLGRGLETVRVRSFNHTGPGQSDRFVVPALARRIARAEAEQRDTVAVGSLDPVRDLTDVRDVVRAYRMLALRGDPGEVYNVCSGVGVTIADVASRLAAIAARPFDIVQDPALVRPVEVPRLVGDPSKLAARTGFIPGIPLDETLADVLEDARAAVRT